MVALAPYLSTNGTEQSSDRMGILQLQEDMHLASKENLGTGWWAVLGCLVIYLITRQMRAHGRLVKRDKLSVGSGSWDKA